MTRRQRQGRYYTKGREQGEVDGRAGNKGNVYEWNIAHIETSPNVKLERGPGKGVVGIKVIKYVICMCEFAKMKPIHFYTQLKRREQRGMTLTARC